MPRSSFAFIAALCLMLAACATSGRKLADLPEPVSSLHVVVNESPEPTTTRSIAAAANAQIGIYMHFIGKEVGNTFDISNVRVTTGPLQKPVQTDASYVLLLRPSSVRARAGVVINVDAVLVHVATQKPVWSYLLVVDGNPQKFSRASVQELADEMLAQNIIAPKGIQP
ncbi:fimbrillin family protein [Uliginosibacterium sp. H3]|uniref:Fimbrillin family protein n=1 Tax=Uliginosibacterium silvisoli TaxID=3114758 RepID=A0ABU6K396_9RHOO|nr:fimbrillin family protein [Uliginosibacterium sp. H3]